MKIFPVYNERALYVEKEKAIVIADLHIGIEFEYSLQGVNIFPQTARFLNRIKKIIEEKRAEKVIILGDLKHVIAGKGKEEHKEALEKEKKEVRYFIKKLDEFADIYIIKGNHDGMLRSKRAKIIDAKGMEMNGIAFVHGHAWPSESIMKNEIVVLAHIHPCIRVSTKIGYSYLMPCWVKGRFRRKDFLKIYKKGNDKMEFIIMPAFNPLCGGIAVNREMLIGPMSKIMDIRNSYVYMLNGINLGRIRNLI